MEKKCVIVDYGLGNLYSIAQACRAVGYEPKLSNNASEILEADSLILPGVGAFKVAMENLEKKNLVGVVKEFGLSGKPMMGVCLGMQLLFDESEEFGLSKGLGIINGTIKRFPSEVGGQLLRIPHIGWNKILKPGIEWEGTPLRSLKGEDFMYFVHSFYAEPINQDEVLTKTVYQGFEYCSSFKKNNIYGFQFHPEKSGQAGLRIYKDFLTL